MRPIGAPRCPAAAHVAVVTTAPFAIVDESLRRGSDDNLTVQVVRIDALPEQLAEKRVHRLGAMRLPLPATLQAHMVFDS